MIEEIYSYFTLEMLYYWVNLGILPFWVILIFFPQSHLCRYFVTSIFPVFILSSAYVFMLYKSYFNSYDFISNFTLSIHILSKPYEVSFSGFSLWYPSPTKKLILHMPYCIQARQRN